MAVIIACIAEVASQFSESGGPYLYVRTAFGKFLGMQTGWFHLLGDVVGMASLAALFVNYLATFLSSPPNRSGRALLLAIVIAIPALLNFLGVRSGATLSNIMTAAKVTPLVLLILFGAIRFALHPQMIHASEITSPGLSNWIVDPRLRREYPRSGERLALLTLQTPRGVPEPGTRHMVAQPVIMLAALVALVLLIACANIATLLLTRGVERRREVSIRIALGAGRARVCQQVLAESLLLSVAGAAVGLAAALWTNRIQQGALVHCRLRLRSASTFQSTGACSCLCSALLSRPRS